MDTFARVLNNHFFAILAPAAFGFGMAYWSVRGFEQYGWSLFLGTPIVVSFLAAFCHSFRRNVPFASAYGVSLASLLTLGAFVLLVALDGLICLLMAFPLAMGLGLIGAAIGHGFGIAARSGPTTFVPMIVVLLFPGVVAFDGRSERGEIVRSVTTSVVVSAPIEKVWRTVIAFPKIAETPGGVFKLGVAYPIEARIEGKGVGAVRHCVFSTGGFVEPITRWDEPNLLAFDVTESPPPMKELSVYEHVDAPHLHGFMNSRRGQFQLEARDGKVVLEGTTWYSHSLAPQWYWGPISDFIIHRIHERVLEHIKRTCERD